MQPRTATRPARLVASTVAVATVLIAAGCHDTTSPVPGTARTFNQVQRLGNPLVSEVFVPRKDHPIHGSIAPDADPATFAGDIKGFVAAFRPNATTLQNTLASALLPDVLIVQTDKDPSTAGWLSWALANGYGGRKLTDDVVDIGLSGIFSNVLDPTQALCAPGQLPLCTDNVGPHSQISAAFPYLAAPK